MALRSFSVFFLLLLLAGCSSSGTWGWYVIDPTTKQGYNNIRFLINGFGATILLSIIAAVLSMGIGLIVALPG
ncbi:MAG: amino acid ABC transporter permease, partial [Paracoccaceae bacterium]